MVWRKDAKFGNLRGEKLFLGTSNGRMGAEVTFAQNPGENYYVDGNRTTTGDGKSWTSAYKTLSEGLAASHANIASTAARNWAGRNTIYVKAGSITEDLVLFADKTDVIGVGAKDSYSMPCIVGNHVPTAGTSCRFYNVQFRGGVVTGGIIMTLASGLQGTQFHGCYFQGWSTSTCATIGLKSTASPRLEVHGCKFLGAFSTVAIELLAGDGNGTLICDNIIQSAGIGIRVNASFTCDNEQAFMNDNRIFSTGLVIDENANKFGCFGNLCCCTGGAFGATSHDIPDHRSAGNIITGNNITGTVPFATIA